MILVSFFLLAFAAMINSTLPDCLAHLVSTFPRNIHKAAVFAGDSPLLSDVLVRLSFPVVINTVEHPKKMDTRRKSDLVVVLGDVEVSHALKNVLWDRETVFVVLRETGSDPEVDLREMSRVKAVNGYVAVADSDSVVYGYEPYQMGRCNEATAVLLGRCHEVELSCCGAAKISNGNKCYLDASVVDIKPQIFFPVGVNTSLHVSGIEALLFRTFTRRMNFTARYSLPSDGLAWGSPHPPTGIMGDLIRRKSEFAFGLISPIMKRYYSFDLSMPYDESECVTFLVPAGAGRDRQHWLNIIVVHFTPIEWILVAVAFLFVMSLLCIHLQPTAAFTTVFSSFLGNAIRFPGEPSLKCLILLWIIYSLVLSTVFKASLGSKIIVPLTSPEIDTIRDLLDSDLNVTGHSIFFGHLLDDESNRKLHALAQRYHSVNYEVHTAVGLMLTDRRMTYASDLMPMKFAVASNPSAHGKFHSIKECIKEYTPVVALQKNSPFTPVFDDFISKVFESGISKLWKARFVRDITPSHSLFNPLNLKQSAVLFVVLFIGYAVAFLAFTVEILIHRKKKGSSPFSAPTAMLTPSLFR